MTYHPKTDRPRKLYSNPEKLLSIYRWMETYFKQHRYSPSNREIVEAGFASSTSVVRFYFDHMEIYGMLERDYNIARGLRLKPLARSHPIIKSILEKEKENVSNQPA